MRHRVPLVIINGSLVESDSTRAPVVLTTKELRRSCRGKTSVLSDGWTSGGLEGGGVWVDLATATG